jgi:ribonuclease-3
LRASLVKKEALASIAEELSLGRYVILGQGEKKSGGHRRHSILADCLESLLGAVLLDGGFDACSELVSRLYHTLLQNLPETVRLKDPKSQLQEYLQKFHRPLPTYEVIDVSGQDHEQFFKVECRCELSESVTHGHATSRRAAEQEAADKMMRLLARHHLEQRKGNP